MFNVYLIIRLKRCRLSSYHRKFPAGISMPLPCYRTRVRTYLKAKSQKSGCILTAGLGRFHFSAGTVQDPCLLIAHSPATSTQMRIAKHFYQYSFVISEIALTSCEVSLLEQNLRKGCCYGKCSVNARRMGTPC